MNRKKTTPSTSHTFTYNPTSESIPDGSYVLNVKVADENETIEENHNIEIDNTAPIQTYNISNLAPKPAETIEINVTTTEDAIEVNLSGTIHKPLTKQTTYWQLQTTPNELGCLTSGSCLLSLATKDAAGNQKSEGITLTINSTTTPPKINLQVPLVYITVFLHLCLFR